MPDTRLIAAFQGSDPDTVVGLWLAERYLGAGEPFMIKFFPIDMVNLYSKTGFIWRVEPGRMPEFAWFSLGPRRRKSPAFADRYCTSATGRTWTHLMQLGKPVAHLVDLVDAVHAGTVRDSSIRFLERSKKLWRQLNVALGRARARAEGDLAIFYAMRPWLDKYEASQGTGLVMPLDWERELRRFPHEPGTFALILKTAAPGGVVIGRDGFLGRMLVRPGYYGFICNGKDGLAARLRDCFKLARDLDMIKQVDFLRLRCSVVEVWYTVDPVTTSVPDRQCVFARCLLGMPGATVPLQKFGLSACLDCPLEQRCRTHLAHFESRPSFRSFQSKVRWSAMPSRVRRVVLVPEADGALVPTRNAL